MRSESEFPYDVFLAHSSKDKPRVRELAERLKGVGLRIWLDEWVIRPGDAIFLAMEQGLEASRTIVLCLSPAALGSEWVGMERSTTLFLDPTNTRRRFIPLLLVDCQLPAMLRHYRYIDYRTQSEAAFAELVNVCTEGVPTVPSRPGSVQKVSPRQGAISLAYVFSRRDSAFRDQLDPHLSLLLRQNIIGEWHDVVVDSGLEQEATGDPTYGADVVLLLVSADLLASTYLWSIPFRGLLDRHAAGVTRVIPVILRACDWATAPFGRLPPLPQGAKAVTAFADMDSAWSSIASALRSVCNEIREHQATQTTLPTESESPRSVTGTPRVVPLFDVFKKSGVPTMTFVEPTEFSQLKLSLAQPGRGVVIQGPSGIGKTTALQVAMEPMPCPAPVRVYSARRDDHRDNIRSLRRMRRGTVVIDDFHRLDPSTKADVADHLKYLADTEPADLKMVVVGIPHTGRALIELAPDLATRIDVFPFQKAPDGLVAQVIEKGERALNAIFTRKTEIVIEAAGSLNLAQYLCFHLCEAQGVHETQQVPTAITGDIATAFESVMRALTGKFGEAVRRFAALGGPADHTCLDLLGELALNSEEGVLSLNQLKDTQPRLARGIDQFFREEWFQSLCEAYPNAANCLFVDRVTGTLVADDPQLLFYLRRVSYSQLAHSAGKSRVPGDERPAYGGTREAPAEGGAADPRWSRYDAFVSYRRQEPDQGFARDLVVRLEKDGYAVAIDERDFAPNDTFLSEMERCVRESRFTLAVVSPRYLSNPTCTEEAVICKVMDMGERRRRLIPLVMEKVEVPLWMYDIVGIDFASTDPLVDPMARLEQALGRPSNSEATSQNRHVDPEALELILVGYMMTVCGEAGQIFRPTSMLDHGIDGEVEFKDDEGRASGSRIYVQLKSGGSYLRRRRSDGKEVFLVHNERHLEYLAKSRDDVYLVVRDAVGSVRWTNMTRILRGRNDKESREVVFEGERLDAAAVRRVRDRVLG